jgi:hypothetical protein
LNEFEHEPPSLNVTFMTNLTAKKITKFIDETQEFVVDTGPGPYLPLWQASPVLRKGQVNENSHGMYGNLARACIDQNEVVLGGFDAGIEGDITDPNRTVAFWATLRSIYEKKSVKFGGAPALTAFMPIFDTFDATRRPVAVLRSMLRWRYFMRGVLSFLRRQFYLQN